MKATICLFLLCIRLKQYSGFVPLSTCASVRPMGALKAIESPKPKKRSLPKRAFEIYTEYASRLWKETNTDARRKIANDRVSGAIRQIQGITRAANYTSGDASIESIQALRYACDDMIRAMGGEHEAASKDSSNHGKIMVPAVEDHVLPKGPSENKTVQPIKKKKKQRRSITFGATMGAAVACWVFSGNYIFTGIFTLMTILGQLEYYRMVINTGVYPARRISVLGACAMFWTALFTPNLHQICLPMFGLWAMVWFLTMKRTVTTIPEIAATFTGMFYLGYVPSFWVRIRLIGNGAEPTRLAPLLQPYLKLLKVKAEATLPAFVPQVIHLPITTGAKFIFWSWLCLAFSDVGAYFVGKKYGKTKLGKISPAAGATSPNKTVEGVLGGCAVSALLGIAGAWIQKWPMFFWTGAIHGTMLGLLGLLGDLTASMLKRDAGLKDFGDLIPEHGGILDRVDSFIWSAPYSWLVCAYVIPAIKAWAT